MLRITARRQEKIVSVMMWDLNTGADCLNCWIRDYSAAHLAYSYEPHQSLSCKSGIPSSSSFVN